MTGPPEYSADDLARHELRLAELQLADPHPGDLVTEVEYGRGGRLTVAAAIAQTCAVGYGGHYGEVLEDEREGVVLSALAAHLAPIYRLEEGHAYSLLLHVRDEWTARLAHCAAEAQQRWAVQRWVVTPQPLLDDCPACGRRIKDSDETGCEAPDGQRWCINHALDALVEYRPRPRPGGGRP